MDSLVSTEWLAQELGAGDLRVVDATWLMPGLGDPAALYEAAHLPGAVFMDIDALSDTDSPLPTMLPPAEKFAALMGALGIGQGDRVVIYDNSPHRTAARGWVMFRSFGFENVAILDGGFGKWQAEGRPVEGGWVVAEKRELTARLDQGRVRTQSDMRANLDSRAEQVVDARSAPRFTAEEPEPRPNMAGGHIPGSHNLPSSRLFQPDGTYKLPDAIRAEFDAAGVDLTKPVVTTCGSGITACILIFALHLLGRDAALYDGSWSEWGADPTTPKETGAR